MTATHALTDEGASPTRRWLVLMEVLSLFGLMLFYIWGIREFSLSFTIAIFALTLASNAMRGEGYEVLGLSWRSFRPAIRALGPITLAAAAVILTGGLLFHTARKLPPTTLISGFLLYCAWGLFQQYLINAVLLKRLLTITTAGRHTPALAAMAGLFAVIHAPNWFLMSVTLPAGYFSGLAYLRHRNLLTLGLAHALLGSLLYLVVPDSISHGLHIGPNYWALFKATP